MILPESSTADPSVVIESEYRAARQIGGDFFQIIRHASDGSTQAGMIVAQLVGFIRSTAELNAEPLVLLEALHHLLIDRDSSQATCLL